MQVTIDASSPPSIDIYLGVEQALDVVGFSIECEVNQLPVFKMRQVASEDGIPVFVKGEGFKFVKGEGFKFVDTEFAFEKLSFVGDWTRLARALSDEKS